MLQVQTTDFLCKLCKSDAGARGWTALVLHKGSCHSRRQLRRRGMVRLNSSTHRSSIYNDIHSSTEPNADRMHELTQT